jgi:hypothetical protein
LAGRPEDGEEDANTADDALTAPTAPTAATGTRGQTDEEDPAAAGWRWEIRCPVCGRRYTVRDGDARIRECENCVDEHDRTEIGSVKPRRTDADGRRPC